MQSQASETSKKMEAVGLVALFSWHSPRLVLADTEMGSILNSSHGSMPSNYLMSGFIILVTSLGCHR